MQILSLLTIPIVAVLVTARHTERPPCHGLPHQPGPPAVRIPTTTVIGKLGNHTEIFHGIPYGEAPTGDLRLRPPVRYTGNQGVFNATTPAAACIQPIPNGDPNPLEQSGITPLLGDLPLGGDPSVPQSEDCLTVTVTRPQGTTGSGNLPVIFWIFGGGFEFGYSDMYDGSTLVQYGVEVGRPFIFVAVNYRVGGFGFLGGSQVLEQKVANLGMLDQRLGLEWMSENIGPFGGDPEKVTLWGQSAGSMSVYLQTALATPTDPVDSDKAQDVYDQVVRVASCNGVEGSLQCMREADLVTFTTAVSAPAQFFPYSSIALSFLPRPDGTVLPESPHRHAAEGKVAPVPVIAGHAEDDATLFALFPANVTTTADLAEYLHKF